MRFSKSCRNDCGIIEMLPQLNRMRIGASEEIIGEMFTSHRDVGYFRLVQN